MSLNNSGLQGLFYLTGKNKSILWYISSSWSPRHKYYSTSLVLLRGLSSPEALFCSVRMTFVDILAQNVNVSHLSEFSVAPLHFRTPSLKKMYQKWKLAVADVTQWIECQACEPKGRWLDSQSGPMPGLQARSPVGGAREATIQWCFSPSLSLSLPSLWK